MPERSDRGVSPSEADRIMADVRGLRSRIIDAWHERGVILTEEEQEELRQEIGDTCHLLTDLTRK